MSDKVAVELTVEEWKRLVEGLRRLAYQAEDRHDQSLELTDYEDMNDFTAFADRIEGVLPPEGT